MAESLDSRHGKQKKKKNAPTPLSSRSAVSVTSTTIEGSLSVITDCMDAAVVCFDGTLVNI